MLDKIDEEAWNSAYPNALSPPRLPARNPERWSPDCSKNGLVSGPATIVLRALMTARSRLSNDLNPVVRAVMLESMLFRTFWPRFVDGEKGDVHERPNTKSNPKKAVTAKDFFIISAAEKKKKNGELPFK
jgi:hypothetical protein